MKSALPTSRVRLAVLLAIVSASGCRQPLDAGGDTVDAATPLPPSTSDAAVPAEDAGGQEWIPDGGSATDGGDAPDDGGPSPRDASTDAGPGGEDAAWTGDDAGGITRDAGTQPMDAGSGWEDAGGFDGGAGDGGGHPDAGPDGGGAADAGEADAGSADGGLADAGTTVHLCPNCPAHVPHCAPTQRCLPCSASTCGTALSLALQGTADFAPTRMRALTDGVLVLAGPLRGPLRLGAFVLDAGTPPAQSARTHLFVVWTDRDGMATRGLALRAPDGASLEDLDVSGRGHVLVRGRTFGPLTVAGQTLQPTTSISSGEGFLLLFAPDGSLLWARLFPSSEAHVHDGVFTHADDVALAGRTGSARKSPDFGSGQLQTTEVNGEAWFARLAPDGTLRNQRLLGPHHRPVQLFASGPARLRIAGHLDRDANLGGGVLTLDTSYAMYLLEVTLDGQHVWSRRYPEPSASSSFIQLVNAPHALTPFGQVTVMAKCGGTVGFAGGSTSTFGHFEGCMVSFDDAGDFAWIRGLGASHSYAAVALDASPWGHVALAGTSSVGLNLYGGGHTPQGTESFFAEWNASGVHVQPRWWGTAAPWRITAAAATPEGGWWLTGTFASSFEPDWNRAGPTLTPQGRDLFLIRLGP